MILAVFQETSANSCLLTEREGWCCQQCADSRHMGELATLHGTRQHYDLTISNVQMMGCTDSTESARVISKESLEIVQIVWSVHALALSLSLSLWHFYFSEFALGCAWCNFSCPAHTHTHTHTHNSPHQMIRGRADAAPNAEWLQSNWQLSCVRLWTLSLHACRWEVSVLELLFRSAHSGSGRWIELKKKKNNKKKPLLNEIWRETAFLFTPGKNVCVCVCKPVFCYLLLKINISLIQICTKMKPCCSLLANTLLALQFRPCLCYTNSVCMFTNMLHLEVCVCVCVCVGLRWRNNFISGLENTICVLFFPRRLCVTLETLPVWT